MAEKFDVYSYFWNNYRREPNWQNIRKFETYLIFRQKILASFLLKKDIGKEKLEGIVFDREWRKDPDRRIRIYLKDELSLLNEMREGIFKANLANLPKYSCFIEITFSLKKPYLSKDDDDFYIIDNPIVKDKVFKLPMVRATTWKGALRFATLKVIEDQIQKGSNTFDKETVFRERAKIVKLFGNEKDSHEDYLGRLCLIAIGKDQPSQKEIEEINKEFERYLIEKGYISKKVPSRSGRLFFYPTFFEEISLDVITPLSRETRTPTRGPIYFETVPDNSEGTFRLLYYPFDLISRGELDKIEDEINEDVMFLSKALKKMLYEIGFSAKKTSGFGVINKINNDDVRVDGFKSDEVKKIILNNIHQS